MRMAWDETGNSMPRAFGLVKYSDCCFNSWNLPRSRHPDQPNLNGFSTSLQRGLAILAAFTPEKPLLGVSDLAEQLGMTRSTTHRYISTLESMRYLVQDRTSRKYRLGVRVLDLGLAVLNSMELRDVARPFMEQLCERSGHTVNMAVLDGQDIVYVERVRSRSGIDLHLFVGSRLPAYCTSMGKVLLAYLPKAQLDTVLDGTHFEQKGPRTITSREALMVNLQMVRQLGVAMNDEELARGLRSIAAPIFGQNGAVVAAVNMAVHATELSFQQVLNELGPMLIETTTQISAHLGFRDQRATQDEATSFAVVP